MKNVLGEKNPRLVDIVSSERRKKGPLRGPGGAGVIVE